MILVSSAPGARLSHDTSAGIITVWRKKPAGEILIQKGSLQSERVLVVNQFTWLHADRLPPFTYL